MSDYYDKHTGEEVSESTIEERYRELLDEEVVSIGSLTYSGSVALERIDPIAYRCGFADYVSSEIDETIVESGYFVRVLTDDGEVEIWPEWFADRQDSEDRFDELFNDYAVGPDIFTVQIFDTSDDIVAEMRTR